MTSTTDPAGGAFHLIDHALTVADARDALTSLRQATAAAAPGDPLGLELTGADATAPALQLLIAGARALSGAGAFNGLGPSASQALAALSVDIPAAGQGIPQ